MPRPAEPMSVIRIRTADLNRIVARAKPNEAPADVIHRMLRPRGNPARLPQSQRDVEQVVRDEHDGGPVYASVVAKRTGWSKSTVLDALRALGAKLTKHGWRLPTTKENR